MAKTLTVMFQEIADAIRSKKGTTEPINAQNFATEIESIEVGENPEIWTGTTLISREDVLVENVYANTQLTVAEVTKMLSQLTYYDDALTNAMTYWIFIGVSNKPYCFITQTLYQDTYIYKIVGNIGSGEITLFTSSSVTNDGFVGFNPNVEYPVPFNAYGYSGADDYKVGSQNNLINGLVSIENNFKKIDPNIVTIKAGKIGTQLISSPDVLVEKIYFNTELSVEEVKQILSQLTYVLAEAEVYFVFFNLDAEKMIGISKNANDYMILDNDGSVIFATTDFMGMGISFTGWNPDWPNPLIINVTGITEFSGISVGQDNNKLTSLISMNNDFESGSIILSGEYDGSSITAKESINLQDYIDEGKLPLRINIEDTLIAWSTRKMTEVNYHVMAMFGYGYLNKYEIISQLIKKLVINNLPLVSIQEFGISENTYLEIIDLTFCTLNTDMFKAGFSYNSFRNNYSLKHILFRGVEASFFTNNNDARFTDAIKGCCYFDGSGIDITDLSGNGGLKIESGQKIGKIYVPDELVETAKTAWTSWADMIYPISDYIE